MPRSPNGKGGWLKPIGPKGPSGLNTIWVRLPAAAVFFFCAIFIKHPLISAFMQCRVCGSSDARQVLSLGESPLANSFLKEEQLKEEEPKFPLGINFCNSCKLVQLSHVVPKEQMFSNYLYLTSVSRTFQEHFTRMAEEVSKKLGIQAGLVVDIGSNDGILLLGFKKMGLKTIGVEPAANVAKIAREKGVETINGFFDSESVNQIIRTKGKADVITATNVFAHVDYINDFAGHVHSLMKDDGSFVVEIQYFLDTMEKMNFDNIYHEHLYFYTLTSLKNLLERHKLIIFDVERNDSHGGTLRVFSKKINGKQGISENVTRLLAEEQKKGVDEYETYKAFAQKVGKVKENLVKFIRKIKSQGKSIAGFGAPAKSTTLLNYCGLGKNEIDYIVDENPLKAGLYAPGTHIPVVKAETLDIKRPDYIVILAWNFAKEIMEKTGKYAKLGTKYIIPLPEPRIA